MLVLLLACATPLAGDSVADSACPELPDPCGGEITTTVAATLDLLPPVAVPHGPVSLAVGDLAGTGTAQVYVGTNDTVTRLDGEGWTVATDIWSQPDDGTAVFPLLADLTGDGTLDLAIGLPGSDDGSGQVIVFPGPVTGPVDWDSPHLELKGGGGLGFEPAAGDFDGDGQVDLLVNGHGFAMIKLGPFSADTPFDTAVDTLLQGPGDAPQLFAAPANLDGDGITDVVYSLFSDSGCVAYGTEHGVAIGPFGPGTPPLDPLQAES
ncbi:MAG: VCBS repeat-containing protein, partial [Deltaproteobacteria bacterium]|nr:VCBS repeat-containing protein [Deltaproteobacteria bacterium]